MTTPTLTECVFFTSDFHFHHKNIIGYCNRPFHTVHEMNEKLIIRFNETVAQDDTVYILGDLALGNDLSCAERLNGKKFFLLGNHDNLPLQKYEDAGLEVIRDENGKVAEEFMYKGFRIVHSPVPVMKKVFSSITDSPTSYRDAQEAGVLAKVLPRCICGHVHNNWRKLGHFVNVGVEVWNYKPADWESVVAAFAECDSQVKKQTFRPLK